MFLKELRYYFSTPIAYIAIGLYLLTISLFLWVIPGGWNITQSGYAQADGLFRLAPWLLMLLCPTLTMRLITEERATGTWQVLLTKPISIHRIIWGKFFAAWTVVLIAQLPCVIHYFWISYLSEPQGNVDTGAFFGAFIGLIFLSATFCSIGLFCSSFSRSQIVALLSGFALCFVIFYGFDLLSSLLSNGNAANIIRRLGLNSHYLSMSKGVIDLRDVVYMISVAVVFVISSYKPNNYVK